MLRVARIVPEFCARPTPENGATPCAQGIKNFSARGVFYLLNCCTNVAISDRHEKHRETRGALPAGIPNAINTVLPHGCKVLAANDLCHGRRATPRPTLGGSTPKPPRFPLWTNGMIAARCAVAELLPTTDYRLPRTALIPFAFPPSVPYNTDMDSQATVPCRTEETMVGQPVADDLRFGVASDVVLTHNGRR